MRVVLSLGFLCFYPGYLFVRRINISGFAFKLILSIGLSFALVSCIALVTLGSGRWSPAYQTALIVLIVFTDVIFGKGSIISYLFPVLNLQSVWTLAKDEKLFGLGGLFLKRGKFEDDYGRKINPEPNFLWQIEFVKVNSLVLRKEIELVVISDLITQECLAAITYRTGFFKLLTHQLSWIFLKRNSPKYVEFHQFGEFDYGKCEAWLGQNYPEVNVVPQAEHYEAFLRFQLADFVNHKASSNTPLSHQLDEWRHTYNQSLRITLPAKTVAIQAL